MESYSIFTDSLNHACNYSRRGQQGHCTVQMESTESAKMPWVGRTQPALCVAGGLRDRLSPAPPTARQPDHVFWLEQRIISADSSNHTATQFIQTAL